LVVYFDRFLAVYSAMEYVLSLYSD